MAMIVNTINDEFKIDPTIDVDFGDGIFTLNYCGSYKLFLNKFVPMLNSFIDRVINEYHDATMYRYDYEDCFNAMIEDFEAVNCTYWRNTGIIKIQFDPEKGMFFGEPLRKEFDPEKGRFFGEPLRKEDTNDQD